MNERAGALVVFDLDDTLYLEADFVRSGFAAVENALGLEGLASTAWALHERGLRGSVLTEALHRRNPAASGDYVAHAVSIYRSHRPRIRLAADTAPALDALAADPSVELALLTDGDAVTQRNKIEALGLDRWIRRMVLTDELGADRAYWKPHPEGFLLLRGDRRSSSPCIYVADNPRKDFDAPLALGWLTVRVRRAGGLWEREPDGATQPAATLVDLSALASCLRGLRRSEPELVLPAVQRGLDGRCASARPPERDLERRSVGGAPRDGADSIT